MHLELHIIIKLIYTSPHKNLDSSKILRNNVVWTEIILHNDGVKTWILYVIIKIQNKS